MTDALTWVSDNKEAIIGILTGVVTVASLIATMTPNESDNKWVARASKVVSWLALNIGKAKSK
jgi:hypothetical protein|tara:strand:+ start:4139 stop:4327 length:189 start_codon:yes stop_codon:yes gene_type:complete